MGGEIFILFSPSPCLTPYVYVEVGAMSPSPTGIHESISPSGPEPLPPGFAALHAITDSPKGSGSGDRLLDSALHAPSLLLLLLAFLSPSSTQADGATEKHIEGRWLVTRCRCKLGRSHGSIPTSPFRTGFFLGPVEGAGDLLMSHGSYLEVTCLHGPWDVGPHGVLRLGESRTKGFSLFTFPAECLGRGLR